MKRVITAMAAVSLVAAASAATYDGVYVSGLQQTVSTGWNGTSNYVGGLAFDPTQQTGGTYDRVYVANRTGYNDRRGLYSFDLTAGTVSSRLALGDAPPGTDADVDSPRDVAVDSSGTVYMINADGGGGVYKIVNPSGTPVSSWMLGHYGSSKDNDGQSVVMVPTGFGGGYTADSDVLAFDSYYDGATNAILAVKSTSTSTSTATNNDYDVLWTESPRQSGGLRIDSSNVDGKLYIARDNVINSDDLGDGTDRVYVTRLDGSGNTERVYIDGIDPASYKLLDDAIAINQDDGSLWFALRGTNSVEDVFRVDVANAASTNGTYLADSSVVIADLDLNLYARSMAISPDGKQLAIGGRTNDCCNLRVYDINNNPFAVWKIKYGLTGGDADSSANPDGDSLNNLYEYALGGDPTNAASQGISPTYQQLSGTGGNWMTYVYSKLVDPDSGVAYHIEINDDLVYGYWTNANYEVVGTGTIDSEFDSVTNRIPTDVKNEQFIRLIIEEE